MSILKEEKRLGNPVKWLPTKQLSVSGKLEYLYGEMLIIAFSPDKDWESTCPNQVWCFQNALI